MDDSIGRERNMDISVNRGEATPLYRQIEQQLRRLILEARLPGGTRLPSERDLAHHLGVNRTTIVSAYRELAADGLIEGRVGRGTTVAALQAGDSTGALAATTPLPWLELVRYRYRSPHAALVRRVAELASQPGVISLASGVPDVTHSPHLDLRAAARELLATGHAAILDDSPIGGSEPLREALAHRLAVRGSGRISPGNVLVLSGSQQGLYLMARLLLEPGDAVLLESPTYLGALQVFHAVGARLVGVPIDEDGMRVDVAERLLSRVRARLVYTIPNYQNPSGATMAMQRRRSLLAAAQRHQVPVLEDDLYGELFYDDAPPLTLKALDRWDYVTYLGSVSSVLGSGFRLGWLVVPAALVQPLTELRQSIDLHPNNFVQALVHHLLETGSFDAHMAWARRTFGSRRDAMVTALKRHFPSGTRWWHPRGGLYVWCSLPPGVSSRYLLEEAAAQGVVFVPGEVFSPDGTGDDHMRLNFVQPSEKHIEEGVSRLATALGKTERHARRRPVAADSARPLV